jgi:hypothetical protein
MPILMVTTGQPLQSNTTYYGGGTNCSWTVPAGITSAIFEVWGGGGGGGSRICGSTSMCCNQGMPGAGGGYAKYSATVTPGDVYVLCAGGPGQGSSVDQNSQYAGSLNGACCNGCAGGTSYVTGPAFTAASVTLCATGGKGGCGDGVYTCQAWCGWNNSQFNYFCSATSWGPGCGYGGQIVSMGGAGMVGVGSSGQGATDVHAYGGNGGGLQGGAGGVKTGNGICSADSRVGSNSGLWNNQPQNNGGFPGGGGVGGGYYSNCGCCYAGAPGGAGLVRVTY